MSRYLRAIDVPMCWPGENVLGNRISERPCFLAHARRTFYTCAVRAKTTNFRNCITRKTGDRNNIFLHTRRERVYGVLIGCCAQQLHYQLSRRSPDRNFKCTIFRAIVFIITPKYVHTRLKFGNLHARELTYSIRTPGECQEGEADSHKPNLINVDRWRTRFPGDSSCSCSSFPCSACGGDVCRSSASAWGRHTILLTKFP